jgi:uncharacterized protein DUF4238
MATLAGGQVRNWPVIVYRKSARRVTRSTIGKTCSAAELYRIPDYKEQLIRGIVRLNLREDLSIEPGFNFAALMNLGEEHLDPELIERTAIGKLDSDFAQVLPRLRDGRDIDEQEQTSVRRFIAFMRFRGPLFRRRYFKEMHGRLVESLRQQIKLISEMLLADSYDEFSNALRNFNEDIDAHVYHIMLIRYATGFDPLSELVRPKMRVLHTSDEVPFVTCDNPSRPYHSKRVKNIEDSRLPGFKDPQVQMLFPVSPHSCVVLSSNSSWREFAHLVARPSQVREINSALAMMSEEQIVFASTNTNVFQSWLNLRTLKPLLRP